MKIKLLLTSVVFACSNTMYAYPNDISSINIPEEARPTLDKEFIQKQADEIKNKGYIEKESFKYDYLNNIENRINYDCQSPIKNTKLKKNLSEIATVSSLKTVPLNLKSYSIGYAPVGTFNKEIGWTGLTEIFKSKHSGICQFSHFDLKASNGAYSLSKEDERTDVNGKYTYVEVTGILSQGFDYQVIWFENLNMYTLNCINKKFSNEFTQSVINLAKEIDESM